MRISSDFSAFQLKAVWKLLSQQLETEARALCAVFKTLGSQKLSEETCQQVEVTNHNTAITTSKGINTVFDMTQSEVAVSSYSQQITKDNGRRHHFLKIAFLHLEGQGTLP